MYDKVFTVLNASKAQTYILPLRRPGGDIPLLGEMASDNTTAVLLDGSYQAGEAAELTPNNQLLGHSVLAVCPLFVTVRFRVPDDAEICTIWTPFANSDTNVFLRLHEA